VHEESNLQQLLLKEGVSQALQQLEHKAGHHCGHCVTEDYVPPMLVGLQANGNSLGYQPVALLGGWGGEGREEKGGSREEEGRSRVGGGGKEKMSKRERMQHGGPCCTLLPYLTPFML
jgi:hypothetical protein